MEVFRTSIGIHKLITKMNMEMLYAVAISTTYKHDRGFHGWKVVLDDKKR